MKAKCSMNDLISRSALLEEFGEEPFVWDSRDREEVQMHNDWLDYTKLVKEAPAVDAVAVVRCKDCKHSYEGSPHGLMCECPVGGQNTSLLGGDDFCSCGERRADDADRTET